MKKSYWFFFIFLLLSATAQSQFAVSPNQRYLTKNGKPFFWLGDTAWELFHRLNKEEARYYFRKRAEGGFTVIQAVALAEMDGLKVPNAYGQTPLINNDPTHPNEAYFKYMEDLIDLADSFQLNIALLPTWGDKLFKDQWGAGPEIFNAINARIYGAWIGKRFKGKTNIIWILGGDRNPRGEEDIAVWRAMAAGLQESLGKDILISYHPQPVEKGSAQWFHQDSWLSFNMFQNGHCRNMPVYDKINTVYNLKPTKPVIDGEPLYEDHPVCFNAQQNGTSSAYDVRVYAYLDLFAGAFGHTYGCHDIWQMFDSTRTPVNGPHMSWKEALELPGAAQMKWVRKLMESFPMLEREPDQSMLLQQNQPSSIRVQVTRGKNYILVYSAAGEPFGLKLGKLGAPSFTASWYDPRNGKYTEAGTIINKGVQTFTPPFRSYGQDWVLVLQ